MPHPQIWREVRAGTELAELVRSRTFRSPTPAADPGMPVMLITGVYGSDVTMRPMAVWLRRLGYAPKRAGIVWNVDCSEAEMGRLEARLERAVDQADRRAAIVGWSRGGLFARALAVRHPDLVAGIATLGSPLLNPLSYMHPALHLALEATSSLGDRGVPHLLTHRCADEWALDGATDPNRISKALIARTRRLLASGERCCEAYWNDVRAPFPAEVRFASFYSKTDGIVDWHACLDPEARHVRVDASHCGLAVSKRVYPKLAHELSMIAAADRERTSVAAGGGEDVTLAA
jgi:triacylglycerol lipase